MKTEAENLLSELKDEALKMDAYIKDDTKRQNYRQLKERQLLTLQNIIIALEEKEQSIFEKSIIFPNSKDLEQVILGAILVDNNARDKVNFLSPEHFYFDNHKLIFELCQSVEVVDIITVAEKLKYRCGGPAYLAELTNRVASSANLEYHARILIQKHVQRELIKTSVEMINTIMADTEDVFETVRGLMQNIKKFNVGKQIIRQ
jgi:DnaB-like helicase N terminal domain